MKWPKEFVRKKSTHLFKAKRIMIELPTVLVLGAGASCPFGFPSGTKLVKIIIQNLEPGNLLYEILSRHDFEVEFINRFKRALLGAQPLSIDAFLEYRPDFEKIGKEAIAGSLLQFENWNKFDSMLVRNENNWYRYLFNRLNTSFELFGKNNLSMITFNYDRSFEQYFFNALKNTYNKSDDECADKLKSIPIVHVHGSLGSLPWQESRISEVKYEVWTNERYRGLAVKNGGENIIIVHKANEQTTEFQQAHELLVKAQRVYILGFGFNKDNVRRLKIETLLKKVPTKGTAFNLPLQERQEIHHLGMAGNIRWDLDRMMPDNFHEEKCYDFLKNHIVFS